MTKKIKKHSPIRKTYAANTKALEDSRSLVVTISTKNPDRSNDEVNPAGVSLKNYLKNPVVAAFHNYHELPIGKTTEIKSDENGITATVEFTPEGVNPMADTIYELYKSGFMNAWSIGFIPTKYSYKQNDRGMIIDEWELLEYSAVLVPDNPEALTMLRGKGIDVDAIMAKEIEAGVVEKPVEENKPEEKPTEEVKTEEEKVETKAGKVLSAKSRELVSNAITVLQQLLDAAEEEKEVEKVEEKETQGVDIKFLTGIRDDLRNTDKGVGLLLRSINEALKNPQQ